MLSLMTVMTGTEIFLGFENSGKRILRLWKERIVMMVHCIFRLTTYLTLPMLSIIKVKIFINDRYHQLIHSFHNFASLDDASFFYSVRSKNLFIYLFTYKEFIY